MDQADATIEVGMADMKMANAPAMLVTRGLGSCLGIVLYDSFKKVGALGHAMLPKIDEGRVKSNPYKFVDSAIASMLDELKKKGCQPALLKAKIFGGGHMFSSIPTNSMFNIGLRNCEVAKRPCRCWVLKSSRKMSAAKMGAPCFLMLLPGKSWLRLYSTVKRFYE